MTNERILQIARAEQVFSAAAIVPTSEIPFDSGFRVYCEENLCGNYGANYTCPPDCGSPEELRRRILADFGRKVCEIGDSCYFLQITDRHCIRLEVIIVAISFVLQKNRAG